MNGVFVTGTDTGVGKTAVAAGILATLRAEGTDVAGFKPCETGHPRSRGADWPADARCLEEAARTGRPGEDIVPYVFAEPLAPSVAARRAQATIDLEVLDAAWHRLRRAHGLVVVEGAGGLAAPMTQDTLMVDLADRWGLPLLVVARAGLGAINHTALTVAYAKARGVDVLGVVVNGMPPVPDVAESTNPTEIARLGAPLLGVVPRVDVDTGAGRWQAMQQAVADHVDLSPLRALVRHGAEAS